MFDYPQIFNKHHENVPENAIYVGRGSKWGNPFVIGRDGTREDVVEKYCHWVLDQPDLMAALHELRGGNLLCFCSPKLCHAMILWELANG